MREFLQSDTMHRPRRQQAWLGLARRLGPGGIVAWGATLRLRLPRGLPPPFENPRLGAAIYGFWHQCLLPITWYCRGRGIGALISQHADGELIAQVAAKLGYQPIRGSSTRGGAGALEEMTMAVGSGRQLAITLDGPRGPRFYAKAGAIYLARATQAPIYIIHVIMPHAWTLNSWDGFKIPYPGSRIVATWRGPYCVPESADKAAIEDMRKMIEADLNALRQEGEK
jgi:lysophospholipid acyltransferase (LPLAT)-like uncharacterized protein